MAYLPDANVRYIVVHYSATFTDMETPISTIDRWHRKRGFTRGVGYHYYIRRNGNVELGRDMSKPGKFEQGAHVRGNNSNSIGVCFEGGLDRPTGPDIGVDTRTAEQKAAMIRVIRELKKRYPNAKVVGHRDMPGAATQCPGFDAGAWWASVEAKPSASPGLVGAVIAAVIAVLVFLKLKKGKDDDAN